MRSLIVALARNRIIGNQGTLPWRLSRDLQRFKQLTMGHQIIMGRKTFESLPRLLPGRVSVVVSRAARPATLPDEVQWVSSVEAAFLLATSDSESFVIGGGEIYQLALPVVERVYATWVDADITGDTHFPPFPTPDWRETHHEEFAADERNEYPTRFCVYER